MKISFSDETIYNIADKARTSALYAFAADIVTKHFRSVHNMSSLLVCDCIVLNILLNDEIMPNSADGIITCIRRRNRSLYTTVDSAYFPIEDRFKEYAQTVLGDDFAKIAALKMRTTNFIVYVMSLDLFKTNKINRYEIFPHIFSYSELEKYGLL